VCPCVCDEKQMSLRRSLSIALGLAMVAQLSSSYTCKDETGTDVDWFVALAVGGGSTSYYYMDSSGSYSELTESAYSLDQDSNGAIMATVAQLYDTTSAHRPSNASTGGSSGTDSSYAYAEYNDEPPPSSTASSTYAHSKGVVMTDTETGYWLVHSKPHWPNAVADGAGPLPDFTYAQSFMCVSFPAAEIEKIAAFQQINYPKVYDSDVTDEAAFPEMAAWVSKTKSSTTSNVQTLVSSGGVEFTQFAKAREWGKDLYEDLVAPTLGDGLSAETWRDGSGGRLPSFCTTSNGSTSAHAVDYDVLAVNLVTMPDGTTWKGTADHSKWAVTLASSTTCIGDINRFCSQESRGGGTLCLNDTSVWQQFSDAVAATDPCWDYDVCNEQSTQCYWCGEDDFIVDDDDDGDASPSTSPTAFDERQDDYQSDDFDVGCCHYDDASCTAGDVCCMSNCDDPTACSYTEGGCKGHYGQAHNCVWTDGDLCVVGGRR